MTDYSALAAQFGGQTEQQPDYSAVAAQFGGHPVADQGWQADPVVGKPPAPAPIGAAAFPDFLRRELANADWGTRQIAGFGTAASNAWEKLKQFVGEGDPQQIEANKIIEKAAPVGAIAGNVAMTAIPFAKAGNTLVSAAKVGGAMGALNPIEGETSVWNKKGVSQTLEDTALSALLSMGGQKVANMAGDFVTKKASDLAAAAEKNAPRTATINAGMDEGLVAPPSQINPTWWNNLLESFGGKAATAQDAAVRNAPRFDDLARRAVHLPDNAPLEPATMQAARDLAYEAAYKPVAQAASIKPDEALIQDLVALSPASKGGAVKNAAQGQIDEMVNGLANQGEWNGQQLIRDIRELRKQASANFKASGMPGGNPGAQDLAHAQSAAADALENMAGRQIGGDAIDLMREGRKYIAKTHDIENAIVEGGGSIDPRYLARRLQAGAPLSDELKTIAAFANNFKSASRPVSAIGSPGVSALNPIVGTVLGGALGSLEDHGAMGGLAGAVGMTLARKGARSAALSRMTQNRLRDIYRLGLAPRVAARGLQYAPVAGAVLGREALSQ